MSNHFGNYENLYRAYSAMRDFCSAKESGCDNCPYDMISTLTGIPCCFYWVSDYCIGDRKASAPVRLRQKCEEMDFLRSPLHVKVIKALHDLIELQTGKRKGETDNEYRWRQTDVVNKADMVLGEVEDKFATVGPPLSC